MVHMQGTGCAAVVNYRKQTVTPQMGHGFSPEG